MLPFQLPPIIGHRGVAAQAPENTLASVRRAAELQIPWVEVDVTLTACGEVVLFHDMELDRCSNGRGPIALQNYDYLRTLDAGSWFGAQFENEIIPTLTELITELNRLGLGVNLEIKPTCGQDIQTAQRVAHVLRTHIQPVALLVSSFSQSALMVMQSLLPNVARGLLTVAIPEDWAIRLSALDCVSLHCDWRFLTQANTHALQQAGYRVIAYTINDPVVAQRLFSWGVDSIISDQPDVVRGDNLIR